MIINPQNISSSRIYSRIISLVPSQTELLFDLGLDEEVKAITKFCIHPIDWYKNKIRIGGTKSLKIDIIKKINPDLIIANKEENVKEQVEELAKTFNVFVTDINNLHDALEMIKNIGTLTAKTVKAAAIANKIQKGFNTLSEAILTKRKIKASYLIWKNPYMAVGGNTFINDMMQYCGLENIFTDVERYPEISLQDLKSSKPEEQQCELVLLSSEPYPFKEKHLSEIKSELPLIKIILVDGEMFSWYGSRLLKAAEYFKIFQKNIGLVK